MPDTYYFNNTSKNWTIYANLLEGPLGKGDVNLESSGGFVNLQDNLKVKSSSIVFEKGAVLSDELDTTHGNINIPITFNNFKFCDPKNMATTLTKTRDVWYDLSGDGYKVEFSPKSDKSKIYIKIKICFLSSTEDGELITFALYRTINNVLETEPLFIDSNIGSEFGITNSNIYYADFIDSPETSGNVCYYLKYKMKGLGTIDGSGAGVLGHDNSNSNFLMTQELYIPPTDICFNTETHSYSLSIAEFLLNGSIDASFNDISLSGNIEGDISLNNNMSVKKLNANGLITIKNELTAIDNTITDSAKIYILDGMDLSGVILKKLNTNTITIESSLILNKLLEANNGIDISGSLNISNDLSVNNLCQANNGLIVNGNTMTVNGNLDLSNESIIDCSNINMKTLNVTGLTTIDGLLNVNANIDVSGILSTNKNITISNDLFVDLSSTISNTLTVNSLLVKNGNLNLNNSDTLDCSDAILNSLTVNNNSVIEQTLEIGSLNVLNNIDLSGTMIVNGSVTTICNELISGLLTLSGGDLDMNYNIIEECSEIQGGSEIIIDPSEIEDSIVFINGDLEVKGMQFIVNSETLEFSDNIISLELSNNEGGIEILKDGNIETYLKYKDNGVSPLWELDGSLNITGNIISNSKIIANDICGVLTGSIANGLVLNSNFDDESITTDKIADNAITAEKISNNTITTLQISPNAITGAEISNNIITTSKISNNTIRAEEISNNIITKDQIATNAITAEEISNNIITTDKIALNAVTGTEISNNAITNKKISTGISGSKIVGNISYSQIQLAYEANTQGGTVSYVSGGKTSDASGSLGELCYDDTYLYICVHDNPSSLWKRLTLNTIESA